MTAFLSGKGNDAIGQVKDSGRRMREDLDEAVTDASKRGEQAFAKVSENCREAITESLHDHPATTVALAIGLGFLFGAVCHR